MECVLGFAIAMAIGLTGVGGGIITTPVLILFVHLPAAQSVGTALLFAAIIKFFALPAYLFRSQVNFRILLYLLAGGLPGVLAGSLVLGRLNTPGSHNALLAVLGTTIVGTALFNLYRLHRNAPVGAGRERPHLLPPIALLIGAEVGFSSAGAGALGSLVLMSLTTMPAAQVVGTDVFFGLVLSTVGGGIQWNAGNYDAAVLTKLLLGGLAGILAGTNLASRLPSRVLRLVLSLWLATLGAQLCWRAIVP